VRYSANNVSADCLEIFLALRDWPEDPSARRIRARPARASWISGAPLPYAASMVSSGSPPPFDRALALARCDGDTALLELLVAGIPTEGAEQVAAAAAALRSGDARGVRSAAHRLKGSLQCVAAGPAEAAACTVEAAGHDGDLERAKIALDVLRTELERLYTALRSSG
jgi:hypothetical protein